MEPARIPETDRSICPAKTTQNSTQMLFFLYLEEISWHQHQEICKKGKKIINIKEKLWKNIITA